ncbi:MAG: cation diffusion facilitator family transporter [Myxococcota bacterium]
MHGHGHGEHLATPIGDGRAHGRGVRATPRRALATALALTSLFMVVEVVVGLWSGSLALLADAGHMLGDSGALALALVMAAIASRPRDVKRTYGYRRAEVLGALANAVALAVAAIWIVREAIERIQAPPEVQGMGVLGTATAGLVVNLTSAWVLARSSRESINVRSAMFHVLGDALGSVAAMVAGVLLVTVGWRLADPVASLCISLLLFYGASQLLRETMHVLMEGAPRGMDIAQVEQTILQTAGVQSVHDLHVWALTPDEPMLTCHVVLAVDAHGTDVARFVGERLAEHHGIHHVTVQPEAAPPESVLVPLRRSRDGESAEVG